jgi:hypothetical protein
MAHELLFLDNNFYRRLCTSKDGSTFQNWVTSLNKSEQLRELILENRLEPYITPFAILEGLGITVPYPEIKLPQHLKQGAHNAVNQFSFVNDEAKKYFASLNTLKIEHLQQRFLEQSEYTHPSAKAIERMHLMYGLQDNNLPNKLITSLSFDYVTKYQYSRECRKGLRALVFVHGLFVQNSLMSGFSKYRLTKGMWEDAYEEMQQDPSMKIEKADEIHQLMKLKKHKDFLDTDLIHLAVHGYFSNEAYRKIICITCDDYETILFRVRIYKTLYNACLSFVRESDDIYSNYETVLNQFANGVILICNNNCEVIQVINVEQTSGFS